MIQETRVVSHQTVFGPQAEASRIICGCLLIAALTSPQLVGAGEITSTCRITAVDAVAHTVTLVRKTASGERTGVAKVADGVKVTIDGQSASLSSLRLPVDATVVYDAAVNAVVEIRVGKSMVPAGPTPTGTAPPLAIAPFDAAKAKEHQEAWAKHLGVPVELTNSIGMKLVLIPPGEFMMGSTDEEVARIRGMCEQRKEQQWGLGSLRIETPRHRVVLTKVFRAAACEVTVGQFRQFVQATQYRTDAEKDGKGAIYFDLVAQKWEIKPEYTWRQPPFSQQSDEPVVAVSWNDAVAFCAWLSHQEGVIHRLPTEAEWEYACRAGTQSTWYCANDDANLGDYAWYRPNSNWRTHPVGQKLPCPWGLHDMHGNASEWCADRSDPKAPYYAVSPINDPTGPTQGDFRIIRSGSWVDWFHTVRSALRDHTPPNLSCCNVGFRVFTDAVPATAK